MQKNDIYQSIQTRGTTQDEVILKVAKSVSATIVLAANSIVSAGELLKTLDGGKTYTPAFVPEYDNTKADYEANTTVVHEGKVYKALVDTPDIDSIDDNTQWKFEYEYVINGVLMVTFSRETKETPENFKAAVLVDGEVLYSKVPNKNESSRIAAYPTILLK